MKSRSKTAERTAPPPGAPYTVREVANLWRRKEEFVRELIKTGQLGAFRIGTAIRIRQEDLELYYQSNRYDGPDPRRGPKRKHN